MRAIAATATTQGVRADSISHVFRADEREADGLLVIDDVSFDVPASQFLAIVGASGCGKTTLLNMMAGLLTPSRGSVYWAGERVSTTNISVGYMTARASLFPWRSALRNVEFALETRKLPKSERRKIAYGLLETVGLRDFGDSYPSELSQGMRQRVALARMLAVDPSLFLMDEPFAALDAQTRLLVQGEFLRIWEGSGNTVVFVTHDLTEAVALADRVIVMSARPGRIKLDVTIDLPRPRSLDEVRFDPRFQELAAEVWKALRDEVLQSDELQRTR